MYKVCTAYKKKQKVCTQYVLVRTGMYYESLYFSTKVRTFIMLSVLSTYLVRTISPKYVLSTYLGEKVRTSMYLGEKVHTQTEQYKSV